MAGIQPDIGGVEPGRLVLREAGYCVLCNRIVERDADGACRAGHPAAAVQGSIRLADGDPVPQLPPFNVAAFLVPFLWGPVHGQWAGALFLPILLFLDSIIATADTSPAGRYVAGFAVVATVGFAAVFARRANGMAYRRIWERMGMSEFVGRQRAWGWVSIPIAVALLGWAVYFRMVMAPGLAG